MDEKTTKSNEVLFKKPKRFFETSGTVNPQYAYSVTLDNVTSTLNQDLKTMIDLGRYFSIFAPRQSGKTTFLEGIRNQFHLDKTYVIIILNFQQYKDLNKNVFYTLIEENLYEQLVNRLNQINCEKAEIVTQYLNQHRITDHISFYLLFKELNRILLQKKIVILIDEFDGIPLNELENFLASIRDLYQTYKTEKHKALYSVGIIGIRSVTKLFVGGVSPFNIADQVNLPPFSLKNVRDLYAQYTEETNQPFTEDAVKRIHEETAGQPWLVNRLGAILTTKIKPETVTPINETDIAQAIQIILNEKNNHFDNLYEKAKLYKETFVEIVFDNVEYEPYGEEQSWLEQYGLIKNQNGHAIVTNNIYKLVHMKAFARDVKANQDQIINDYLLPGNRLDINHILLDFYRYIARIGVRVFYEHGKPYEKTGQFLLTVWLFQFAKDDAGDIRYEVHTGLGRIDVLLTYKGIKYIIETKMNVFEDINDIRNEGIKQLTKKYLSTEDVSEGYLLIFDVKTQVGTPCIPEYHTVGNKKITCFIMGIGL